MSISIKVTKDDTPELMQKLNAAIGRFVVDGAAYVEKRLKAEMLVPKTGKAYKRGKTGKGIHIASAPGESPAVDSSNLFTSIQTLIAENSLEAKIGTPVEYALYLEDGTSRMAARPLWEKTAIDSLPTLENLLKTQIERARS